MAEQMKGRGFRYNQPFLNLSAENATNTPVETEVVGTIPTWLNGSLYRNGPGIFRIGDFHVKHLFDGFAILHRFHLQGGKVTYTSRVLDTETYENSVKANRLVATQFGTFITPDPCKTLFGKMMSFFKPMEPGTTDNVSVNIVEHGDRLYALTETPWMVRVNPESLTMESKEDLKNMIAVHMATAHPHFDRQGNMYNLATAFNPPHNYNIVRIPPAPANTPEAEAVTGVQLLTSLQSRWKFTIGYNHSFGMSRDHFVILEQPITMSSFKFLTNNWRKAAVLDNANKHPGEELIFRIVRRSDNQEVNIRFRAETAFTFHFVNCFEDEGQLVVDFAGYSDLDILDNLYLKNLDPHGLVPSKPYFRRYVLPLSLDQAKEGVNMVTLHYTTATAVLRPDGTVFMTPDYVIEEGVVLELPRINYDRVNTEKYRYVYGTRIFSETPELVKLDLERKAVSTWREEGYHPGEPVFVASPGASAEDEGVILSPVLGREEGQRCFLLVLDAASFQELGRAYAPQGVQMSVSFHGSYVTPLGDPK
ncbi:hypothetical protein ACOMHN_066742 [Nucella lapillus]